MKVKKHEPMSESCEDIVCQFLPIRVPGFSVDLLFEKANRLGSWLKCSMQCLKLFLYLSKITLIASVDRPVVCQENDYNPV